MGTSMPLLREQVQKEELLGHDMGIVDLSLSHGFREPVPTSDMHTVAAGNRQVRLGIQGESGAGSRRSGGSKVPCLHCKACKCCVLNLSARFYQPQTCKQSLQATDRCAGHAGQSGAGSGSSAGSKVPYLHCKAWGYWDLEE